MNFMDKLLDKLKRGCVELVSAEELARKLALQRPLRVKLGVDPTSADLHLGHTVVLSKLRAFQEAGHQAVLILGDFTARIGDPSGRDSTRPPLSPEEISAHAATYQEQAYKILDRSKTELHYNSKWLEPFVREELLKAMRRITLSRLIEREDFQNRIRSGNPITLLEIIYPILQGYDSVAVQADVELGGSDQLFNLLMGRQIQKDFAQESQVVMTMPLLVGLDGQKKMSKSYGNAIALEDSPRDIFGKIMKLSDELMESYYELLTQRDLEQMRKLHPMQAKKNLAEELTARFYSQKIAEEEREFFENTFSRKQAPENARAFTLSRDQKLTWSDVLIKIGAVQSRKEAQRLLGQGAVEADTVRILRDEPVLASQVSLKVGKHKFYKLNFE
jgi:tyrosyl-tRNA synthetase